MGRAWPGGSSDIRCGMRDAATGRARHTLEGHRNVVVSAGALHGASLASGSYDNTVRVWDAATGRARHTLEGHRNVVQRGVVAGWGEPGQRIR